MNYNEYDEYILTKQVDIHSLHSFFVKTFENNYFFSGEAHDFWEAVFVLKGTVGVTADDEVYYLRQNRVIFHKPMEFHRIWADADQKPTVCVISFTAKSMPNLTSKVYNIPTEISDNILSIYEFAKNSLNPDQNNKDTSNAFAAQFIANRLEMLFSDIISKNDTSYKNITSHNVNNYARIINVLGQNIKKRLTVEQIALLCETSPSSVKKVFAKYSDMGVIRYFNTMKVNRAKVMLMSGMSVAEAASTLGFEDQNYFSTIFKRIDGKTPSFYKK